LIEKYDGSVNPAEFL
jgi:hypothetical protein